MQGVWDAVSVPQRLAFIITVHYNGNTDTVTDEICLKGDIALPGELSLAVCKGLRAQLAPPQAYRHPQERAPHTLLPSRPEGFT